MITCYMEKFYLLKKQLFTIVPWLEEPAFIHKLLRIVKCRTNSNITFGPFFGGRSNILTFAVRTSPPQWTIAWDAVCDYWASAAILTGIGLTGKNWNITRGTRPAGSARALKCGTNHRARSRVQTRIWITWTRRRS